MAVVMGNKMPRNTGMALQYELRTLQESPNKTDTVPKSLKRIKVQHTTPETRLHTLWRGPMKVIKSLKGQYTLLDLIEPHTNLICCSHVVESWFSSYSELHRDLTTLKEKEYHSTHLKEFIFNPNRVSPLDVARKDYLEFFIEEILHHTGNTNRLSTLNFKVKWQGYDDTYNSYEPWKNLRSTEQLHLYLIRQNLKHVIPKQHQASYESVSMRISPYLYPMGFYGSLPEK
jgi:Chromo (CHRromatin Organisation MOdifier) domain